MNSRCRVCSVFVLLLLATGNAQLPPTPDSSGGGKPGKAPRVLVDERMRDLGTVYAGDRLEVTWTLKNAGSADLIIDRTTASCGCTIVKLTDADKIIPPGGAITLHAQFDSTGRKGEQVKSVTVYTNDSLEPQTELSFRANVLNLYYMVPSGRVNLRALRPGQTAPDTLDITPGEGNKPVEIVSITYKDEGVFTHTIEPLELTSGQGHRVKFTLSAEAAVGPVTAMGSIKLRIGDIEKDIELQLYAEVVADLVTQPKMITPTGQSLYPGRRLAPVIVRSTEERPFEILEIVAPKWLTVEQEKSEEPGPRSSYSLQLTVGDEAPAGPFGATLGIRTSSLAQPLVEVPVFGVISPPIVVDPPVVVLRADGTTAGTTRRLRLQASPRTPLVISLVESDNPAVKATINTGPDDKTPYIQYLDVKLMGELSKGKHTAHVRLTTNVPGASSLTIPVNIEVR